MQLREELAARGSSRSGLKASLQRRLHGLLVQAAIARRSEAAEEDGTSDGGQCGSRGTESAPPAKRARARPRECERSLTIVSERADCLPACRES